MRFQSPAFPCSATWPWTEDNFWGLLWPMVLQGVWKGVPPSTHTHTHTHKVLHHLGQQHQVEAVSSNWQLGPRSRAQCNHLKVWVFWALGLHVQILLGSLLVGAMAHIVRALLASAIGSSLKAFGFLRCCSPGPHCKWWCSALAHVFRAVGVLGPLKALGVLRC